MTVDVKPIPGTPGWDAHITALEQSIYRSARDLADRGVERWLVRAEEAAKREASREEVEAAVRRALAWQERSMTMSIRLLSTAGVG